MAKNPRLSGSARAILRRPDPKIKPPHWRLLWPALKYGGYHKWKETYGE